MFKVTARIVFLCTNNAASKSIIKKMKNVKTTQYNHSKYGWFSFCVFVFCYYLITPSTWRSILLCFTETHLSINILYKLLFILSNNIIRDWLQKIFLYSLCYLFAKFRFVFPNRLVKSMQKFFHAFPNFSFVCFHWKKNLTSRQSKQESQDWESQQLNRRSVLVFGVPEFQRP